MAVVPLAKETSPFIILRHRISLNLPHWLLQFAQKQFYAQCIESVTEDVEKDLIVLKKLVRPANSPWMLLCA
jgi:hypothetical protein